MGRRSGLGRGLGALIPTGEAAPAPTDGVGAGTADPARAEADTSGSGVLRQLPIADVHPNRHQPRENFDDEALQSLTDSISALGVLQPILVRPAGDGTYELIAGERRWRASTRAGLATIPALVRTVEDSGALEQALVENLHREDLNALEEAAAYQQLMGDFGLTQEQVAVRVGKSRSAVSNTLRLFQLPPSVQKLLAERALSAGHGRALLGTPDQSVQETLARRAAQRGSSVREVEQQVRRHVEAQMALEAKPEVGRSPGASRAAGLLELEEVLSAHLDTRVSVTMGAKRGKLVVEFATPEDLERIYRVMTTGPERDD